MKNWSRPVAGALIAALIIGGQGAAPALASDPGVTHAVVLRPAGGVRVLGLQTEAQNRPLGIDVAAPRLSWRMSADRRGVMQSTYRVVVARTRSAAAAMRGTVWDSGSVHTSDPFADYAGPALRPRTRYWWNVEVRDDQRRRARASAPRWFETAFTDPAQWKADWIGGLPRPSGCEEQRRCSPAPLLRREFRVRGALEGARLYASGLGYGTYHLNGHRVGDAVLSPGFTEYTERALYTTSDVTSLLRRGHNTIGAELGRGPYGSEGDNYAGYSTAPWHAEPRLRLELHLQYADGRHQVVRTGPGWTTVRGPRLFDDYMLGETYDARRASRLRGWSRPAFDDHGWKHAPVVPAPQGTLEAQVEQPIRPQRRLAFQSVTRNANGNWVFDLGQDVTGNAILRTALPSGTALTLHYGEKLDENGSVDTSSFSYDTSSEAGGGPMQIDTYIAGPGRDIWRPEFTFKGFRYVEVTGLPKPPRPALLTAQVWHTDLPRIGAWKSSDPLLNQIRAASTRSIVSNSLSIPMDTPIYEKTGYTADGQLVAGAASYLFDTRRFYTKWLTDIRQSVAPNGDMGISAPLPSDPPEVQGPIGFLYASPGWDAALFVIPEVLELFGGDVRPGVRALPEMERVHDYYETRVRGGIIPASCTVLVAQVCPDGLGDWTAPDGSGSGAAVDSTAWYVWMLRELAQVADQAGQPETAAAARARADEIQGAFQSAFYDPVLGHYRDPANSAPADPLRPGAPAPYSQHQNALPLGLGVVPDDLRQQIGDSLAADVRSRDNHLSTGIMGTRFLFEALASTGHVDEAYAVLTQRTYPSYGYWFDELGYTGLGEFWEAGTRSHNHQMYGSVVQWLFEGLAGYRPTDTGFATVEIRPQLPTTGLQWVRAHTNTVRGRVATTWRRTVHGLVLTVDVPANAEAVVHVPAPSAAVVTESGTGQTTRAADAPGVQLINEGESIVTYRIGSGNYRFEVGP